MLLAGLALALPAAASREEIEALLDQAEVSQRVGRYRESIETLEQARKSAAALDDAALLARLYGALGHSALALDDKKEAGAYLQQAIAQAQRSGDAGLQAGIQLERGNLFQVEGHSADALRAYADAAARAHTAGLRGVEARALTNAARARLEAEEPLPSIREALDQAAVAARGLDPGVEKADVLVHLGRTAMRASELKGASGEDLERAVSQLSEARAAADLAGAKVAGSYALGYLGALYESHGRREEALTLTRQASFLAQQGEAPEALYRWSRQVGRLLAQAGKLEEAIASYRLAAQTLDRIHHEFARGHTYGGDSSESVSAVYLELADLLLRTAPPASDTAAHQARLVEVRSTVEQQKAQELRDYFRDDCVDAVQARTERIDQLASSAAVIYPIALPDRLELLLTLPSGIQRATVPIGAEAYAREVRAFRALLTKRTTREYLPHAQQLYDWLVRPWLARLDGLSVTTLVFVPDSLLRSVPVAALHDGEHHLIERFALAITPGLDLTDPRPLPREGSTALLVGTSRAVAGFAPLEHVAEELQSISELYPAEVLLDQEFRGDVFEQRLRERDFTVVHLATHAEFGGEAGESFILTGDGGRLTLDQLGEYASYARFRDRPIELLTLSACETARGDEQAALGLAGVAIKAGARSAIGTLWRVNDLSSAELLETFYRGLQDPSVSKAEALRRAQRAVQSEPRHAHPYYWAPFLLISNWL